MFGGDSVGGAVTSWPECIRLDWLCSEWEFVGGVESTNVSIIWVWKRMLAHHEGHHLLVECMLMVLISGGVFILLLDVE